MRRGVRWPGWLTAALVLGLGGPGCVPPGSVCTVQVRLPFSLAPTAAPPAPPSAAPTAPPPAPAAPLPGPNEVVPVAATETVPAVTEPAVRPPLPAAPLGNAPLLPPPRPLERLGRPISLNLDDTEVRKAVELIARQADLNILVSPAVTGRVSANVKGLTADQALDAVARLANLVIRRDNGLIYVFTPEEISRGVGLEGWLVTRVYRLNYVRSADVLAMIRPLLGPRGRATASPTSQVGLRSGVESGGGLTAPSGGGAGGAPPAGGTATGGVGGTGGGGTGGNSLAGSDVVIVQDQEAIIRQVDFVVSQLDVPPLQVEIEAMLVAVTHNKDEEFGVSFAVMDSAGHILNLFGNGATINAAVGFSPLRVINNAASGAAPPIIPEGSVRGTPTRGFAADEHGWKFGFVGPPVTAFVRALETLGKVEVLAAPRLIVLNKQQAYLLFGQRLGYSVASQSLVSTVQQIQFLNVGTQLRVRPFISCDGLIRMEIHPERSNGQIVNGIPQTNTTEMTTNVMVPDGGTLIIGGLLDQVNNRQQNGMPLLSDLPGIGALFRDRLRNGSKTELVVILRPRIQQPPFGKAPPPACPPVPLAGPELRPPPSAAAAPPGPAPVGPPAPPESSPTVPVRR